ncbi:hypothetical protein KX729_06975 [Rhizobium sp. XQZ8]|uniref:hypothetical protein n=1 Tax=Rhizobium populisoli TaxID=2859785 RepID=UPI001CA50042|nr:hypothetical protein [Rhizobium populisoli]MBW6421181.1 hypothetical protein [Rhizobium populisoli]
MKIDSGLNGYHYPNRTVEMDRKTEEAAPRETVTFQRSADAITGSSTLLSSSLANALWAVETGDAASFSEHMPAMSSDWVAGAYEEFA